MKREKVVIEKIRRSAELIIIRLGLGIFTRSGPGANILEVESRPAWAATVSELGNEGYAMTSPEGYAAACGVTTKEVEKMIRQQGSLFAVVYAPDTGGMEVAVPLPKKEEIDSLGPHLTG
jgi:hypothetical protein